MADAPLTPERLAEAHLLHRVFVAMAVAVPVCILVFAGLLSAAMALSGNGALIPAAMGAGIGVLAGVFFGIWAGFVGSVHELDRVDFERHHHGPTPA
jgi:hypothetical protein